MSYVGQAIKRFEDAPLVTGQGSFIADITLPNMLHAAVLRSDYAHAIIRPVDVSAARNLPGVVAVLTAEDIDGVLQDLPSRPMAGERMVEAMNPPSHPLLAKGKVCYTGQAVVLVVAEDRYLAQEALESITVDYQPLPPVIDPDEAVSATSPVIHPELGSNVAIRARQGGGDVEAAFARADHVIRQKYDSQRVVPAPLETRGIIADYQAQSNSLTVWNSTQAPHRVRDYLAETLDRPADTIRVVAPDVGGSFGMKDCIYSEDVLVPYLSVMLERPIKWVETRQENMLAYHGRGQTLDMEMAFQKDGTILGMRVRIIADTGAFFLLTTPSAPFNAVRRISGPYKIPAVSVELLAAITNKTPTGAYRGTGGPESALCLERTLDLAARDLGMDPADIRKKNFIPPDAFPYLTATGTAYDSGAYEEGLDRALDMADYAGWRRRAIERSREDGPGRTSIGIGLATVLKSSGSTGDHRIESARVQIDRSGQITAFTGLSPHGQGNETSFAQIVADELGVEPSQVRVVHSDTALFPTGVGTSASRGLIVGGSALYSVLREARAKLALIASHLLDCDAEDISFEGGKVFHKDRPQDGMTIEQLTAAAHDQELLPGGVEAGLDFSGSFTLPESPYSFAAHIVVVEVSRETGHVELLKYWGVHDSGRIINPLLVEGQIHGGIAQGVGQALTEGMVYSPDGQPLTASFMDYAMPKSTTLPDLVMENIDTPSPTNPLGAKGVGSVSTVPSPVAVTNAVLDALSDLGIRHIDMPLTPEKVWRAIRDAEGVSG
ncbi:MAG: xanthine dehydrogenase family protein molybdopterin-binding subunit [Chloroflexi bacterium]|nr:xanthine dehydrogenase family protein molybdopterin-binding subunit [Chloroflexota bacterium]